MKKVLLILTLCLILCGCGKAEEKEKTWQELMKEKEYVIVDVRTLEEYNEGHIVGAINIPYDSIDLSTSLDKNKMILVYCKSGVRSGKAYTTLKNLGYDVYNMGAYNNIDLPKE